MERITAKELVELLKSLPTKDFMFINKKSGEHIITTLFLVDPFTAETFTVQTYEECAEKIVDYLYRNAESNNTVGEIVRVSGFPDINKFSSYCKTKNQYGNLISIDSTKKIYNNKK